MGNFSVEAARRRVAIVAQVRDFFTSRNVLEVETPVIGHGVSTDCHIEPFASTYIPGGTTDSEQRETVYLQTSPELHMKRLLIAGFPDIFQICKVFRNGEYGSIHNPEFTMLEWYRHGFNMLQLIDEVADLMKELFGPLPVSRHSYQDLFVKYMDIDPLDATIAEMNAIIKKNDSFAPFFSEMTDALMYVMSTIIEPLLPPNELVFVYNYPCDQAALSVLDDGDSRVARRFELYLCGRRSP